MFQGAIAVGNRTGRMVDAFLDALSLWIEPVHLVFLWRPQLRDPEDEMVFETALNGRADVLITFQCRWFLRRQAIRPFRS